jgi:predicted kinase
MATAHMICGYLGAGKTRFARRLERELPAIRFTHDEWMVRLYGADPPAEQFADCFARVSALIDQLWPRCLELGLDVVLDLNFWSRAQRDETRWTIAALGATSRLYYLHCDEATAWARIEQRNAERGHLYIARNTFENLKGRFEPPAPAEDHVAVAT